MTVATNARHQNELAKAGLDKSDVDDLVHRLLSDPLYWFPVRHHSPATAWHLQSAIERRRPKAVFIEGPSEATSLIPLLLEKGTRPPVAIYSSFQDDENLLGWAGVSSPSEDIPARWASWYPLVEYSPELVAMKAAAKIGATVRFIDLPHYGRLLPAPVPTKMEADSGDVQPRESTVPGGSDVLLSQSSFYEALAEAGGFRSWDEGWDTLFETRPFDDHDRFREELLTFCAAARLSTNQSDIDWQENVQRERFMIHSVRSAIEELNIAPEDTMVVCGGFHTGMDQAVDPPQLLPEGTVYTTIVPYSYFHISDISGYGAGNRAPQYYARHWHALRGRVENPIADYTVSVLQTARKSGEPVSSADAISIAQHARMLAALRNRPQPILDDLTDAVMTCCCKGNPEHEGIGLRQAIDKVNIGNAVGKVAETAPRLPIVRDFYATLQQLDLSEHANQEKAHRIQLDRREPQQAQKSAFFHRLEFCEVPFCKSTDSSSELDSGLMFRERWQVKWSPAVESRLIDLNLMGDSVEAVATNLLKRQIVDAQGASGTVCASLVDALRMDLPGLLGEISSSAMAAIEEDERFTSLTDAVQQLSVLDRYAMHHELDCETVQRMSENAFARACFAIADIVSAPDDQHAKIVDGLTTLADVVLRGERESAASDLLRRAMVDASNETEIQYLRGALLGLLVEIKCLPSQDVTKEIAAFANSLPDVMISAGDFVHGVISVSRASILTGSAELVEAIDGLLRAADWDIFTGVLPRLRAAMESLHARHKDAIASRVAEAYGLVESESIARLDVSIEVAQQIVELDAEVANIMTRWSFE